MRDTGASYRRSSVPGVTSTSLQQAVAGTYQTEQVALTNIDFTVGTEYEVAVIATSILANTDSKDEVFSWIKLGAVAGDTASAWAYEWFLLRCNITDATQDTDDEAVMEALQKDKKVLKRGFLSGGNASYTGWRKLEFELFQVRLRYGEEIRLLINPLYTGGATNCLYGRLEWRQQGK